MYPRERKDPGAWQCPACGYETHDQYGVTCPKCKYIGDWVQPGETLTYYERSLLKDAHVRPDSRTAATDED